MTLVFLIEVLKERFQEYYDEECKSKLAEADRAIHFQLEKNQVTNNYIPYFIQ